MQRKKPTSRNKKTDPLKKFKSTKRPRNPKYSLSDRFYILFLFILACAGVIVVIFMVQTGCSPRTCVAEFERLMLNDNSYQKPLSKVVLRNELPPPVNMTQRLQNNPNKTAHLSVKDGVRTDYTGYKWAMVQPKSGWLTTKPDSIVIQTNKQGSVVDQKGILYPFSLIGVQEINLESPFGLSAQHALQKCADAGRRTYELRIYHKKPLSTSEQNEVYLISSGMDCGYELVNNGLADNHKEPNHIHNLVYEIANNGAKQLKVGKYSKMF